MSRLKISLRLTLSFIVVFLLMFVGNAMAIWQYNVMGQLNQRLQQADAQTMAVSQVYQHLLDVEAHLAPSMQRQDAVGLALGIERVQSILGERLIVAIHALDCDGRAAEVNAPLIARLEAVSKLMAQQLATVLELARGGEWDTAHARLSGEVFRARGMSGEALSGLELQIDSERRAIFEALRRAQNWAMGTIVVAGMLALWCAGFLGYVVTRSIVQPLAALDAGAQALAAGRFTHRIAVSGSDELANLGRVFNTAAAQLSELYGNLETLVRQRTDELQHRAVQLETSVAVGQSMISILDLDALLAHIVDLVREHYGYYYVGIFMFEPHSACLVARAGSSEAAPAQTDSTMCLPLNEETLLGRVALTRHMLLVNDMARDEHYRHTEALPLAKSEIGLPLVMGEQLLGVLNLQSREVGRFGADDAPVLQLLANQVALAIHNAALYESEKARRTFAETLYQIGQVLAGTLDPAQILDMILHYLMDLVPYDRGAVMLRSGESLEFVAALGFPEQVNPLSLRVSLHENDVYYDIYHSRQPLHIPDIAQRGDWQHVPGLPEARAWLGVPLVRLDEVIGMLSLARETPTPYTAQEVALALAFAGQAAVALQNARLYEQITRFNQQLEQQVAARTAELQVAYNQLEHLDRTKADFITIASHELRTPLTVLRCYGELLARDTVLRESAHYSRMLHGINASALRLQEIVASMLDIARIDSQALRLYPERLRVAEVVSEVYLALEAVFAERRHTFRMVGLGELPEIEADLEALKKVLHNLMTNAIKYTPDGGAITVEGRYLTRGSGNLSEDGVELMVRDTGIGIDPASHELIFSRFYQAGEPQLYAPGTAFKSGGTRLGLAIARGLVEAHGGRLWVESSGCDEMTCPGSEFHLLLPLRQNAGVLGASQSVSAPLVSGDQPSRHYSD